MQAMKSKLAHLLHLVMIAIYIYSGTFANWADVEAVQEMKIESEIRLSLALKEYLA